MSACADTKYKSVFVMSEEKDECIIATEVSSSFKFFASPCFSYNCFVNTAFCLGAFCKQTLIGLVFVFCMSP